MMPLYGLVLAGGESRRMGRDKAALLYHGQSQLHRVMAVLAPHVERAFVSVREITDSAPRAAFPQICDDLNVRGPAAGLLAAYHHAPERDWLVLACDLPLLDTHTITTLCRTWQERAYEGWEAVAWRSRHDGLPEPLCTIWTPRMMMRLKHAVAEGKPCPRRALAQGRTLLLEPVTPEALENINTPEDFEAASLALGKMEQG